MKSDDDSEKSTTRWQRLWRAIQRGILGRSTQAYIDQLVADQAHRDEIGVALRVARQAPTAP